MQSRAMDKFLISSKPKPSSSKQDEDDKNENNDRDDSILPDEPPPKKQKKQQNRDFNENWLTEMKFKNWLCNRQQGPGLATAHCKVCNCAVMNHKPALIKHMNTVKHVQNMSSINHVPPIQQILIPKNEELKKRTELKICAFIAQHNLPLSLTDDLMPFLANTFTDSETIKSINLGRTKATNTIKTVLGPILTQKLVNKLQKTPFSVIMDETTDISVKKQCALTVIYYDDEEECVRTQFLDMYEVKSGKAEDLTNALLTWLENRKIPYKNFVGFASDTTNSMIGKHNSVFSHLKEKVPHIACIKCSCHMIHLVASKACLKLPRSVEDLLRSVGSHFSRSSTRQDKLRDFQEFFKIEVHKILSPSTTRWLSLEACVNRVLEQYTVLIEYFKVDVFEDPSKITDDILTALNNKFTEMYLEFMSYVLKLFNEFNTLFQTEKPLLHLIKPEVYKLIKTIASNYMQFNYCKTTDAYELDYSNPRFFLPLEKIYLGVSTQESINELEKEIPQPKTQLTDFRKTCLSFYIETIKQITQRFSFADPLFEHIMITDPMEAQKYNIKDLSQIVRRFPNIKPDVNIEDLNKEWKKHAMLDFTQLNLNPELEIEDYWKNTFRIKNIQGEQMFPNLKKIITLLMVLPFSNASVERVFSQLKLIKSDNRNRLATDTISALMTTKSSIKNATTFEPSKAMLHSKIKYTKTDGDKEGA